MLVVVYEVTTIVYVRLIVLCRYLCSSVCIAHYLHMHVGNLVTPARVHDTFELK